jgi:hypothetical protein
MADWRVMPVAGLVLALGGACEGTRPRHTPNAVNEASPSGAAPASTPSVVPATASSTPLERDPIPLEVLNAIEAKHRAVSVPTTGEPARWTDPFRLTTRAGPSLLPPYDPVVGVALGAGWGCAELNASGERYRACWLASSVTERDRGKRAVRAKRVPWLGVWPVATAERLCARVGRELECWPALEFLQQRPSGIPEPNTWRLEGQATQYSVGIAAAPNFECALDGDALACHGSDPFGVLAPSPVKLADVLGWQYPLALGHHHGCVRQELDIACWGRGDHGELGFPASERCQDGASEVACSRQLGLARVQGERGSHPPLLVAGDTYSCAVTENFVECWGKSRDGFFPAPGPARIPGLRLNGVASLSAGPRGLCGDDYDGGARCAGAIPAPPRGVTRVVVSQGDDASACGVDEAGIVCWGEAYSPRGRPRVPVRVRVDYVSDPEAPVVDIPGRWDAACDIKRPCTRDWAKPQRCEGPPGAVPWATLARHAGVQRGKVVSVMGNFVVGPGITTLVGCDRWGPRETGGEPPRLCCNGSWAPLGLVSEGFALRLEDLECEGDESRLCCSAPATGQAIVATGTLEWQDGRGDSGWMLRDPKLCSLE